LIIMDQPAHLVCPSVLGMVTDLRREVVNCLVEGEHIGRSDPPPDTVGDNPEPWTLGAPDAIDPVNTSSRDDRTSDHQGCLARPRDDPGADHAVVGRPAIRARRSHQNQEHYRSQHHTEAASILRTWHSEFLPEWAFES